MVGFSGFARLSSPNPRQIAEEYRGAIAACLASAFSSGIWESAPMPVDHETSPHSAHAIISELSDSAQVVVASNENEGGPLLGCVLGSVLDEDLIATYRLAPFGARTADGFLAYIAVSPQAQGSRVIPVRDNVYEVQPAQHDRRQKQLGDSLAGLLFSRWLELSAITTCPRVFVRTREVIEPVLHLIAKNGFEYCGRFEMEFRGEWQDRLVYERSRT